MKIIDEKCPFKWGDKVDHKLFGLGTVNGEPIAVCGADNEAHTIISKGWTVPIEWDDKSRKATKVASFAITLVTRPDAKGGGFWNNEFKKLLDALNDARSRTNIQLQKSFRPNEDNAHASLDNLLNTEKFALEELLLFISEDEKGNHP